MFEICAKVLVACHTAHTPSIETIKNCLLAHIGDSLSRRLNLNCRVYVPNDDAGMRLSLLCTASHFRKQQQMKKKSEEKVSFHNKIINVHKTGI